MHLTHSPIQSQLGWEPTVADIGALMPVAFSILLKYTCEECGEERPQNILIGGFTSHDHELLIEMLRKARAMILAIVGSRKICSGCTKTSMVARLDQNELALYLTNHLSTHFVHARIRELGVAHIYNGQLAS